MSWMRRSAEISLGVLRERSARLSSGLPLLGDLEVPRGRLLDDDLDEVLNPGFG